MFAAAARQEYTSTHRRLWHCKGDAADPHETLRNVSFGPEVPDQFRDQEASLKLAILVYMMAPVLQSSG